MGGTTQVRSEDYKKMLTNEVDLELSKFLEFLTHDDEDVTNKSDKELMIGKMELFEQQAHNLMQTTHNGCVRTRAIGFIGGGRLPSSATSTQSNNPCTNEST